MNIGIHASILPIKYNRFFTVYPCEIILALYLSPLSPNTNYDKTDEITKNRIPLSNDLSIVDNIGVALTISSPYPNALTRINTTVRMMKFAFPNCLRKSALMPPAITNTQAISAVEISFMCEMIFLKDLSNSL